MVTLSTHKGEQCRKRRRRTGAKRSKKCGNPPTWGKRVSWI